MSNQIDAILLAAGLSSRMGSNNKLLLPFRKNSIIGHTLSQLLKSNVDKVIVVAGHQNESILEQLDLFDVTTVVNNEYKSGQVSSVKGGLKKLGGSQKPFMIALGDMPALSYHDYNELIAKFLDESSHSPSIVRPISKEGIAGNPVIFDFAFRSELLSNEDLNSSKNVLKKNREYLKYFVTSNSSFFEDVDNRGDYEKLISSG